jgi:hypothetical protein
LDIIKRAKMNHEITEVELNKLLLDEENPRLPQSVERSQQSMLDYIADTTSIEELMEAIAENGYFPGEPLIVVPHKRKRGYFVVVEGNRRLTSLKLLQDPANATRPGTRMREISAEAKYAPDKVPVVVRSSRSEVLPYLGYRHITGVKQWEPLAKARYIEQLFELTPHDESPRTRYGVVARAIGSRRDHIKRNLDALAVYKEIDANDFFEIEGLNDESIKFSVLSTALADERVGNFVGVSRKDGEADFEPQDPIVNPTCLNSEAVAELTKWLFEKDAKGKTRVGESRNLRYLAAVVDNPNALKAFRSSSPLKIAYQLTSDITSDFVELLFTAEGLLTEAAGIVATVAYDDDAYETARRLNENIKLIGRTLKDKSRPDQDEF